MSEMHRNYSPIPVPRKFQLNESSNKLIDLEFEINNQSFSSSTMPTPRKPRKLRKLDSTTTANTSIEIFSETENQTCSSYGRLSRSTARSRSSTTTLKRPSAPPPPLPTPPAACRLSNNSNNKISFNLGNDLTLESIDSSTSNLLSNNKRVIKQKLQGSLKYKQIRAIDTYKPTMMVEFDKLNNKTHTKAYKSLKNQQSSTSVITSTPASAVKHIKMPPKKTYYIGFENVNVSNSPSLSSISVTTPAVYIPAKHSKIEVTRKPNNIFFGKIKNLLAKLKLAKRNEPNKSNNNKSLDKWIFLLASVLFLSTISFISSFQLQVNHFYQKFLNNNNLTLKMTLSNSTYNQLNASSNASWLIDKKYYKAGSELVKQTVLFCNGPHFNTQTNNLYTLPFSIFITIVFSLFGRKWNVTLKSCFKRKSSVKSSPSKSSTGFINPFQRRNRFFTAALFCILANEIFKMIESTMFDDSTSFKSINSSSELFQSILVDDTAANSSTIDVSNANRLFRIGFGFQPNLLKDEKANDLSKFIMEAAGFPRSASVSTTTLKPLMLAPAILKYSKPKLPPRLKLSDFDTTTTTTTTQINLDMIHDNLTLSIINNVNRAQRLRNDSLTILKSLNQSLDDSSSKTLFEVSMSLYHNEYVQKALKSVFNSQNLKWTLILEKLEKLSWILLHVLVIGMRYYPLLDVLDKESLVCLTLASLYIWFDLLYNVAITGLCEGLKLNISFELLKDIRRIFGIGFIYDLKESIQYKKDYLRSFWSNDVKHNTIASNFNESIDSKLLFSNNRILYTIIKSLPHFFCLSYVTIKLTICLMNKITKSFKPSNDNKHQVKILRNYKSNLLKVYNKELEPKENVELGFEEKYVKNLLKKKQIKSITLSRSLSKRKSLDSMHFKKKNISGSYKNLYHKSNGFNYIIFKWNAISMKFKDFFDFILDENFRFSTRIVCTYTVCFTILYYLTCFLIFYGSIFIDLLYLPIEYKYALIMGASIAALLCFCQLIMSIKKFKLHLQSLYKGTSEQYISPKSLFSNNKIATSSFNFAGFAVTYTTWGYIIIFLLLTLILFQIATILAFGSSNVLLFIVIILMPFALSVLLIKILNRFISSLAVKYCFLQRKSEVLALKNIRTYSLFLYFKFFYDCFTGIAHCIIRMIKSIVVGLLFMPRIDYSFMGRSLEKMDAGFMSYIGYLYWESHHTNPITIAFCDLLRRSIQTKTVVNQLDTKENSLKRTRIINRWHLYKLLSKNMQLISQRKWFIRSQSRDNDSIFLDLDFNN